MNKKDSSPTSEIGRTGLNYSAGIIDEEVLPDLTSDRSMRVYESMSENDAVIGGILFAIDMLIRQVEWTVEPHPDGAEGDAEFLESCINDMTTSWSDFISEVLSMLPYGFSYFEIVYKRRSGYKKETSNIPSSKFDDGKLGWKKFGIRAQSTLQRWEFSEEGSLLGFVQRAAPDWNENLIPINKSLLFRTRIFKNNPEGRSVLRTAYRSWYFKKRMEEIEGVGIERDLAGLPMASIDKDILSSTDPDSLAFVNSVKNIIRNVRQDKEAGIIWPIIRDASGNSMATFELLSSGGTRTFDITNIIERYDKRIASSVLADFILLGQSQVGSYALSSDKTELFAVAIGAWLTSIEDVINRYGVARLWDVNGMDTKTAPKIVHKDIEKPDLTVLGGFLQTLAGLGMPLFPDQNLEKFLREIASIPPQGEDSKEAGDEAELAQLGDMLKGLGIGRPPEEVPPPEDGAVPAEAPPTEAPPEEAA